MNKKLLSLALSGFLLFLPACQANRFNGQWTLHVQVEQVSIPECANSFLGKEEILYLELAQDGKALSGFPILSSGPNAAKDVNTPWNVLGEADGNTMDIYIYLPNSVTPGGCGDVNHFAGELDGNTIVGTYQGGDCNSYSADDTPSGRVVMEDVTGGPVPYCTWSGTFTMTRSENE